jgi:hypothetical protein
MLVTIQFPFADLRPFLGNQTRRLLTPDWPTPRAGTDFIRLLGQVRDRVLGGVKEWPGEHIFCDAAKAVRFDAGFSSARRNGTRLRYCAFRRFFSDGAGLARIEVGIGFGRGQPWTLKDLLSALHDTASLPVSIGRAGKTVKTNLFKAGAPLARLMLNATTSRQAGNGFKPDAWWLTPCEPMVLIEHDTEIESVPVPPDFRSATPANVPGVDLAYGRMNLLADPVAVWLLGSLSSANRDYRRRLRIHLLRLHAQGEVVKEVLRAIHTERLTVVRTKPDDPVEHPSNRLQQFLHDTITRMEQKEYSGLPQSDLLRAAEEIQDSMTEGERTAILARLQPLRKAVFSAVERFTDDKGSVETMIVVEAGGTFQMTKNEQHVNISGTVTGNVQVDQVVGQTISNALNRIQTSEATDDLKARLTTVQDLIAQLVKQAPPEVQQKAAKNLDILTKEATAKTPDRAWYEVSANGLIEAGKTVAELAGPISTAVKAVLALL